jgi:hypothetical protein
VDSKVKMLIALQLCHIDYVDGFDLANLIAELQDDFCPDTEFVFFLSRKLMDETPWILNDASCRSALQKLSAKFKTSVIKCNRFGEGYPMGPADMWFDLIMQAYDWKRSGLKDFDCLFTIEADGLPVTQDWHYRIRNEWKANGTPACGAVSVCSYDGKDVPHINGNMVVSHDFCKKVPELVGCPAWAPWDVHFAPQIMAHGSASALIHNFYRKPTITKEELFSDRNGIMPAYIHGVRDDSGRRLIRERFCVSNK